MYQIYEKILNGQHTENAENFLDLKNINPTKELIQINKQFVSIIDYIEKKIQISILIS